MGLLLALIGLVLWLGLGWFVLGIILIVVGLLLFFAAPWPGAYGYTYWHGRRAPP